MNAITLKITFQHNHFSFILNVLLPMHVCVIFFDLFVIFRRCGSRRRRHADWTGECVHTMVRSSCIYVTYIDMCMLYLTDSGTYALTDTRTPTDRTYGRRNYTCIYYADIKMCIISNASQALSLILSHRIHWYNILKRHTFLYKNKSYTKRKYYTKFLFFFRWKTKAKTSQSTFRCVA